MAATTLQRTAYAALGPIQILDQKIEANGRSLTLSKPVVAVAASKSPLYPQSPEGVFAALSPDGSVDLYALEEIRAALGF